MIRGATRSSLSQHGAASAPGSNGRCYCLTLRRAVNKTKQNKNPSLLLETDVVWSAPFCIPGTSARLRATNVRSQDADASISVRHSHNNVTRTGYPVETLPHLGRGHFRPVCPWLPLVDGSYSSSSVQCPTSPL